MILSLSQKSNTFAMIDVLEDTKNIEEKDFEILHLFNVSAFSYVHKLTN